MSTTKNIFDFFGVNEDTFEEECYDELRPGMCKITNECHSCGRPCCLQVLREGFCNKYILCEYCGYSDPTVPTSHKLKIHKNSGTRFLEGY